MSFSIYKEKIMDSLEVKDNISIPNGITANKTPHKGDLMYNNGDNYIYYGDGSNWNPFVAGGIGSLSNEGTGADVFDTISGSTALLRRLHGTSNGLTITQNVNDITIDNTLTGINLGLTGSSVFVSKSGSNLQFRKIIGSTGVSVVENTNDITISSNGTGGNSTIWSISDEKPSGTHAGTSVSGINQRTLNTITSTGPIPSNVTLSSNLITIQPGRYLIQGGAPSHQSNGHRLYLVNNGTNVIAVRGSNSAADSSSETNAILSGFIEPLIPTIYRLDHYISAGRATNGLGDAIGQPGEVEVYTKITIMQVG